MVPVVLLLLLFYRRREKGYGLLVLYFVFAIINIFLLVSPMLFAPLDFTSSLGGSWNWSGKIYAIAGSILFYFLFRGEFSENDFIGLKQKKGSLKFTLAGTFFLVTYSVLRAYFFQDGLPLDLETLGFQLTMPGIDEELAVRGVMLGLLASTMSDRVKIGTFNLGPPGIWVTSIIFGLTHSLQFSGAIQVEWLIFASTFVSGFVLAWMTLKSRSILMPVIAHNLLNFFAFLTRMLK